MRRDRLVPLSLTALLLSLASSGSAGATAPRTAKPASPPPPAASAPGGVSGGGALTGIPGMDFSALPAGAQRELANVFSDEFCYCGCPHTLGACLRTHTGCQHAKRMARLGARLAAAGASSTEIILGLSQYYSSFRAPRAKLEVDPRMCMGEATAPVTLVEFSDFECPSCAQARPALESFAKKHGRKVRFCYAPYPLPAHPNGLPAAQAALWARDKGKFWEMHDALFEQQEDLSPAALVAIAGRLGLPGAELQKALKVGTYAPEVERYRSMGRAAGVKGTPSLFFNGRLSELGLTEDDLAHTVEDETEWRANKNAWAAD